MWLHFIGKNRYGIEKFVNEAERIGVNRAIPYRMLANMNFGDKVFTAIDCDKSTWKNKHKAEVFGYFTVDSVMLTGDEAVREKIISRLDVITSTTQTRDEVIMRECGNYTISARFEVRNSLQDIYRIIKEVLSEIPGKTPIKVLIGGSFTKLQNAFTLRVVNFFRGIREIVLNDYIDSETNIPGIVFDASSYVRY